MRYRPTVLNIFAGIFLLACLTKTIKDYEQLSKGEGWGLVGMTGLAGFGFALLVIDLIVQFFFQRKK